MRPAGRRCRLPCLAAMLPVVVVCRLLSVLSLLAGWAAARAGVDVVVRDATGRVVPGAVVYVESAAARAAVRPLPQQDIVQQNRQFLPAVSLVPVGTAVSFPNQDTVRHHVYSFSPVKRFEIKLYVGTPPQPVVFDQPGIAALGCNIHDTMAAWVVVVETPWYGFTDTQGRLSLDAVPPGPHRLRAWHPGLPPGTPPLDMPLAVPAQGQPTVQVRLQGAVS